MGTIQLGRGRRNKGRREEAQLGLIDASEFITAAGKSLEFWVVISWRPPSWTTFVRHRSFSSKTSPCLPVDVGNEFAAEQWLSSHDDRLYRNLGQILLTMDRINQSIYRFPPIPSTLSHLFLPVDNASGECIWVSMNVIQEVSRLG